MCNGTIVPRCEMAIEPGTQAIDRAAELLVRVMESGRPLAVGELAAHSGLPKSTTSRLVGALERRGLVQRSADRGRLSPGPVLLRFAHRDGGQSLVELAAPVLERLAAETRETINLAVPGPLGAEHLDQRDSEHFVGVTNWVGRRVPHHVAANGKVFMAFGAVPVPAQLERFTPHTITKPAALEAELERVRAHGYAMAVDELELGLAAMAAAVHDAAGEVVAALSISGPTTRFNAERRAKLAPILVEQARSLSSRLGNEEAA
jgi:IclR family acetate operon transcriptional repressor